MVDIDNLKNFFRDDEDTQEFTAVEDTQPVKPTISSESVALRNKLEDEARERGNKSFENGLYALATDYQIESRMHGPNIAKTNLKNKISEMLDDEFVKGQYEQISTRPDLVSDIEERMVNSGVNDFKLDIKRDEKASV